MSDSKAGLIGIGLSAALGGLGAMLMDLCQKQDASAIYQFTGFVNKAAASFDPNGLYALPVGGVGLLLMIAAIVLAFLTGASNTRAAFYSGASVLSVLMTMMPYSKPLMPEGLTTKDLSSLDGSVTPLDGYIPASYAGEGFGGARLWFVQAETSIPVTVIVHTEGAKPAHISGVLYDLVSGKSYQLGYAAPQAHTPQGGVYRFDFMISAGAAKDATVADLKLRVEAEGYKTTTAKQTVTSMKAPVMLEVTLAASSVPQFLQRALERPTY